MLSFRRLALVFLAALLLPYLSLSAGDVEKEINGLKVIPADGKVRIEINKVGDIEFRAFTMSEPERLIVDCIGARYDIPKIEPNSGADLVKGIRTSQYQVDPVLISRIVIDLSRKVDYRMFQEGDVQVVELAGGEKAQSAMVQDISMAVKMASSAPQAKPEADQEKPVVLPAAVMGPALPLVKPAENQVKQQDAPVEKEPVRSAEDSPWLASDDEDAVDEIGPVALPVGAQDTDVSSLNKSVPWSEPYARGAAPAGGGMAMGSRKITIDVQGADIKTVLRTISEFSGVNIVAGNDVKGEVNVHIKDCPWEEALEIILKAHGFGYREEFGMVRVAELSALLDEELQIQTAEKKKEELLPLITRIIFVNNSKAEELRSALESMLTSQRASIDVDQASNALIVRDIERNVEKISDMVKSLDKRTFQVDINAKLVEVDVEASQEMGINWNLLNLHKAGFGATGSAEVDGTVSTSSMTLKYGMVRSWGELNAMLQMLEKSNKANIISNPRITTMDNREATILVGKEIPLIVADEAGNPVTELTKIGIMLKVIPHVNADKTITLDLHPEVSELQSESTAQGGVIISTAEADTRVIVENGDTAVIGGLIKKADTYVIRGVPVLKDIPFLGRLFSSKSKTDKKTELVIFVTPTIVE